MAGIIFQWYLQYPVTVWLIGFLFCLLIFISLFFVPLFYRFQSSWLNGICVSLIFISIGAGLTWKKDIRHHPNWFGKIYQPGNLMKVSLLEPPVEKPKSYKALAEVFLIRNGDSDSETAGKIIIYFKKDSISKNLDYGNIIAFQKNLQPIKNSGNPGGFDYRRFSLFKGITHQVFLNQNDFVIVPGKNEKWLDRFILTIRNKVLEIIRTNIVSPKEAGLAEALLIGYENELDRTLVQSYTNTGVVHIIAISGLHLGIIYWLLVLLLKPLKKKKQLLVLHAFIIIASLWLFSLLAGAQPSITRSAVMFTCIAIGESMSRKTNIFNTMAISAFLLLLYNPFWLWDVGFQLSYAAVLSIIIFFQPIYLWFYFKNKLIDMLWKLNAVTIAAQLMTTPISLYHFNQFPNYFLFANFVAVPLSSIILIGEIFLCAISIIKPLAFLLGKILTSLIWVMNTYIERIEALPFGVWEGIHLSFPQTLFLMIALMAIAYWLMESDKKGLQLGLVSLLCLFVLRTNSFVSAGQNNKIIVYNVPRHKAIDVINGRHYFFIGDTELVTDDFIRNFHLKPSRILFRVSETNQVPAFTNPQHILSYGSKKILMIDSTIFLPASSQKSTIDLLVISKNPKLYINQLAGYFDLKQVVVDGSVPRWKSSRWKKDCDSLGIPFHNTSEQGAFVMNLY